MSYGNFCLSTGARQLGCKWSSDKPAADIYASSLFQAVSAVLEPQKKNTRSVSSLTCIWAGGWLIWETFSLGYLISMQKTDPWFILVITVKGDNQGAWGFNRLNEPCFIFSRLPKSYPQHLLILKMTIERVFSTRITGMLWIRKSVQSWRLRDRIEQIGKLQVWVNVFECLWVGCLGMM